MRFNLSCEPPNSTHSSFIWLGFVYVQRINTNEYRTFEKFIYKNNIFQLKSHSSYHIFDWNKSYIAYIYEWEYNNYSSFCISDIRNISLFCRKSFVFRSDSKNGWKLFFGVLSKSLNHSKKFKFLIVQNVQSYFTFAYILQSTLER